MKKQDFVDMRYGFPVRLLNIEIKEKLGQEFVSVNGKELDFAVVSALIFRHGRLTGLHIRYLRRWMQMTTEEFARKLGVSHPAVLKWEAKEEDTTRMQKGTEMLLRIQVAAMLKIKITEWEKCVDKAPKKVKEIKKKIKLSEKFLENVNTAVYQKSLDEMLTVSGLTPLSFFSAASMAA